jgi:hypothetical protein
MLTLAVDFISFNGKLMPDRTIALNWEAAVDQNHAYFDVEKKINGSWVTIGRVTSGPPYRFIDISPLVGDNIYRIKGVEQTGKVEYSKVINVKYEPSAYIVSVFPNPVHDQLYVRINAPKSTNLQITLSDMQGKLLYSKTQHVDQSILDLSIPVQHIASQLFIVKITDQEGKVIYSDKLLKN